MDREIAEFFGTLNGIHIQEVISDYVLDIEPMAFCTFDTNLPTNGQHLHNCYELCIVTGGVGEYLHGNQSYIIQEGDVFIANPGVLHEIRLLQQSSRSYQPFLHLVFFNVNIYGGYNAKPMEYIAKMIHSFLKGHLIVSSRQHHILLYLEFINNYKRCPAGSTYGIESTVTNMALEGIFSLVNEKRTLEPTTHTYDSIVDVATMYIGSHLPQKLYLMDIAKHTHTSVRNLQLSFKKYLKKTVTDYIRERRLAVAAAHLRMNFKVSDVCSLVGIHDPAQFSRLFKQNYGMSPKKYQIVHASSGMIYGASFPCEVPMSD